MVRTEWTQVHERTGRHSTIVKRIQLRTLLMAVHLEDDIPFGICHVKATDESRINADWRPYDDPYVGDQYIVEVFRRTKLFSERCHVWEDEHDDPEYNTQIRKKWLPPCCNVEQYARLASCLECGGHFVYYDPKGRWVMPATGRIVQGDTINDLSMNEDQKRQVVRLAYHGPEEGCRPAPEVVERVKTEDAVTIRQLREAGQALTPTEVLAGVRYGGHMPAAHYRARTTWRCFATSISGGGLLLTTMRRPLSVWLMVTSPVCGVKDRPNHGCDTTGSWRSTTILGSRSKTVHASKLGEMSDLLISFHMKLR